jgi:hypothetical protein
VHLVGSLLRKLYKVTSFEFLKYRVHSSYPSYALPTAYEAVQTALLHDTTRSDGMTLIVIFITTGQAERM